MSKSPKEREFVALNIAVLTVSDSRTEETDKSGKLLAGRLTDAGHRLAEKRIVPDDVSKRAFSTSSVPRSAVALLRSGQ